MLHNFAWWRMKLYQTGDEKAIRYSFNALGVPLPRDQTLFWAHIYTAILSLHLQFPTPIPECSQDIAGWKHMELSQEYAWYMIVCRANEYFRTHTKIQSEPWLNRFQYQGYLYHLPKELYDVTVFSHLATDQRPHCRDSSTTTTSEGVASLGGEATA